jgi:hypothetical protein
MNEFCLAEVLAAVEGMEGELVAGHDGVDLRDAVVRVANRLAKLRGLSEWKRPPVWAQRDMLAVDLVLRAFGALAVERRMRSGERGT